MRAECQEAEAALSFARRIAQGRLDIVAAELARRRRGGEPADTGELVAQLPEILGRQVVSPGSGRLPTSLAPPDDPELVGEVDAVMGESQLAGITDAADDDVRAAADRLADLEVQLSTRRRALHERIDALQAELVRRYKSGEATVEALLR